MKQHTMVAIETMMDGLDKSHNPGDRIADDLVSILPGYDLPVHSMKSL
jgi:hypothetical protein